MDSELLYTGEMSHSGVEHDDEEVRRQNAAANYRKRHKRKQKELDEDSMKISLISNLQEEEELEDSTRLDVAVSNTNEICEEEEESSDCISPKSCIGDSTRKTTRGRTTLRELLQLPADFGSPSEVNQVIQVMPQIEKFKHSDDQEKKQYKWCGLVKPKGISWSSILNLEDRENKKPQRKNGVFGKVASSVERTQLLQEIDHIG